MLNLNKKEHTKKLVIIYFCAGHQLLSMRSTLECRWYTKCYYIGRNFFFLPQKVSVEENFLVKCGTLCLFSVRDAVWLGLIWAFCMLWQSLCVHMRMSPAVSGRCNFLGVIHNLWFLQSFHLLFPTDAWALRGEISQRHHSFRVQGSKVIHYLTSVHLWSCRPHYLYILIIGRERFSDEVWKMKLSISNREIKE